MLGLVLAGAVDVWLHEDLITHERQGQTFSRTTNERKKKKIITCCGIDNDEGDNT
jgi:hypothetical protein